MSRKGARASNKSAVAENFDVFINCPFDAEYQPIFFAIVFTVIRFGYVARCALETDNAGDNRLFKIIRIIGECRFAVHDISRTEINEHSGLPRFNMPLELGIWLGAHHLGGRKQTQKSCVVFDRDRYRYMQYISDINGQDIHPHGSNVQTLIAELADWLRLQPGGSHTAGGGAIHREYVEFQRLLPQLAASLSLEPHEIKFGDFNELATQYIATRVQRPAVAEGQTAETVEPDV